MNEKRKKRKILTKKKTKEQRPRPRQQQHQQLPMCMCCEHEYYMWQWNCEYMWRVILVDSFICNKNKTKDKKDTQDADYLKKKNGK